MPTPWATRLYIESGLAAGTAVALAPEQAHRLRTVLRLGQGDVVALFNGRDGEWRARIAALGRGTGMVMAEERLRAQADDGDLWLVFAPIKRARLDFLVEKATELGVSALVPVVTAHTMVERLNPARLHAIACEAAEQSERLTLPELRPAVPLATCLAAWPPERRLVLCDETGAAPPIGAAPAALSPGPRAVLVGPEGGFAESELDALRKLPFVCPVGLGPRVLRSETAALAGLAVVQAMGGDWGAVRRRRAGIEAAPSS
ncbi:MAG TPA: 16S rRNA (uracil(1498)-N(3))-methyltransferase [Stellaceae bacterium]|nr:16S rRNA (uracil(1498)-N(3))-methyltransferase [Stellaceae bacterium]